MTSSAPTNGRPQRKQLADQLDRFDALLDGLSEGLLGAVTDAVRDGTRLAVKDALIEILTDPTLRARLHQAAAPGHDAAERAPVAKPNLWSRMKATASAALKSVGGMICDSTRRMQHAVTSVVATTMNKLLRLRRIRDLSHLLFIGVGAGLGVAAVSYLAPHALAAALAGISGSAAAMTIRASGIARRILRGVSFT